MSLRYKGGVISATAPTTSGGFSGTASGIWTLENQMQAQGAGNWPSAPFPQAALTNSLRFRQANSAYLSRTPASAGNQQKWTWSAWVKRCDIGSSGCLFGGGTSGSAYSEIYFSGDYFAFYNNLNATANVATNAVYRDPSGWYHLVVAVDTTQSTDSDRIKLYVNGVQQTSLSSSTYPAQNTNMYVNSAAVHSMGALYYTAGTIDYVDGYMAAVNFVDGQQLTPNYFGVYNSTSGVWQPAVYGGSYGTNGFYLPFTDIALTSGSNAGLGKDFSGNSNYWNTNNISVTSGVTYDAMTDVPTLTSATAGNYSTLNQLTTSSTITYAGLRIAGAFNAKSTIQLPTTGTWYAEATFTTVATTAYGIDFGLIDATGNIYALIRAAGSTVQIAGTGGSTTYNSYSTFSNGDIASLAYDASNGTLNFYKNNVLAATVSSMTVGTKYFIRAGGDGASDVVDVNFGQRPFAYTPPSGYIALNTYNLATPTILQGDDYFLPVAYSGNSSTRDITTGFAPDFVWVKPRSAGSTYHGLYDIVRGAGKRISSNATDAEATNPGNGYVTAFNSTSFSLNSGSDVNATGTTYISWNWKAGGASVSNTDGTITSTVSANQTAGFSVVTYTGNSTAGATVGHGLGKVPAMIIIKSRTQGTADWQVFHQYMNGGSSPWNYSMYFNTNGSQFSYTGLNSTAPTSSIFTLGSNGGVNQSGADYVAYVFAEIPEFSSFGSYTGNGSSSGPFIYTGFRPAYVMVKRTNSTGDWPILDNARDTYNVEQYGLYANTEGSETDFGSPTPMYDFLSNGFKIRNTYTNTNASGSTYIYMAFAENPFKYALAR